MNITELYEQEKAYWTTANRKLFGVTPIHEEDDFLEIQRKIDEDAATYWNVPYDNMCKLAQQLSYDPVTDTSGKLNVCAKLQVPNTYRLHLNYLSMGIDVYGTYTLPDGGEKEFKIAAIPTPCDDLCWILGKRTHYVPRVASLRLNAGECVQKFSYDTVSGEGWQYSLTTKTFECKDKAHPFTPTIHEVFIRLSKRSRCLLTEVLKRNGKELSEDTLEEAFFLMPIFDKKSIFNYRFIRMEHYLETILNFGRYANPLKKSPILLGVSQICKSKENVYDAKGQKVESSLVRSESPIYSLENFRTIVNIWHNKEEKKKQDESKNNFQSEFSYKDCIGFFDSFKTVTSHAAGRHRLLLDNIVLNDGMLWVVDENGVEHNMYEFMSNPPKNRLSCLSKAPFCNNDKPKRIMMNAKMSAQAVPLKGETDPLTHRITARVGFTDLEGYTAADSIVISESFAKRLLTHGRKVFYLDTKSKLYKTITKIPGKLPFDVVREIFSGVNTAILLSYQNVHIAREDKIDKAHVRIFLEWDIPFRVGDKITNLHGAKGTVGLILPDSEMPTLLNKVGNMEAGPLEVIISGFSTMRRGSLGQIFEAWALASDIPLDDGNDYIAVVIEKYKEQMEKYSENSLVTYKGDTVRIPVGLNYIMRLHHHATTKISCSSAEHGYTRTLRLGEMEKLNLIANDCPNILKELGIRSVTKYIGSHKMISDMEYNRQLPKNPKLYLKFTEFLRSMGYELILEDTIANPENILEDVELDATDEKQLSSAFEMDTDDDDFDDGFTEEDFLPDDWDLVEDEDYEGND